MTKGASSFAVDGQKVEQLRIARGLTLDQLAAEAGVSLRTITRLLQGKPMFLQTIREIARVLNIDHAELIAVSPTPLQDPTSAPRPAARIQTQRELVKTSVEITIERNFDSWSPEDQESLLARIRRLLSTADEVKVVAVRAGSVTLIVDMTMHQAEELRRAFERGELQDLKVISITITDTTVAVEQAEGNVGDENAVYDNDFDTFHDFFMGEWIKNMPVGLKDRDPNAPIPHEMYEYFLGRARALASEAKRTVAIYLQYILRQKAKVAQESGALETIDGKRNFANEINAILRNERVFLEHPTTYGPCTLVALDDGFARQFALESHGDPSRSISDIDINYVLHFRLLPEEVANNWKPRASNIPNAIPQANYSVQQAE